MNRPLRLAAAAARLILLSSAQPAFTIGCAVAAMLTFELVQISWWWVAALVAYPVLAFLLVGVIDAFTRPARVAGPDTEPKE